jgi:hypothetical protein
VSIADAPVATRRARGAALGAWVCLAGTLAFALYALWRGEDSNWDRQNYHDYAGYALLHWRYGQDVAAADVQTFFNPLPYVLPYLLRRHLSAMAAAAAIGAVQSVVVWIVWSLSGALLAPDARPSGGVVLARVVALVTAVTGALTLSEVGTSFADLLLAIPLLAALLLILRTDESGHAVASHAAAGVLGGIATGLKLTNGVFAIGLAVAILIRPRPRFAGRLLGFGVGGAAGLLIGTGWWCLYLWRRFGNPIFPLMNHVFRSPDAWDWNFMDPTFQPHSLWQAISVPFQWVIGQHAGAEAAFRDARVAVAIVLIAILIAASMRRGAVPTPLVRAATFFVVSLALWLGLFGIARYAIPLEILGGLLIVAITRLLVPIRAAAPTVLALGGAIILWTVPAEWGHRPWADAYAGPNWPDPLRDPGAFVLADTRLSFLAPYAPAASRFFGPLPGLLPPGGHLLPEVTEGVLHPGPAGAWVVMHAPAPTDPQIEELARIGVKVDPACGPLQSLGWGGITACRLAPLSGAQRVAGWWPDQYGGEWAEGARSELLLDTTGPGPTRMLHLRVRRFEITEHPISEVELLIDGQSIGRMVMKPGDEVTDYRTCFSPKEKLARLIFLPPETGGHPRPGTVDPSLRFSFKLELVDILPGDGCLAPG